MSRLSRFSGSRIEMGSDQDTIKVTGSESERKLARLCIDITDAQRTNQGRDVNFEAIEARDDCVVIQVPTVAVGFVMGSKGATLRELELKHRAFMFLDQDRIEDNKKFLYILGTEGARGGARAECEKAIELKMSGNGSRVPSWGTYNSSGYRGPSGGGGGGFRGDDRRGGGGGSRYTDRRDRDRQDDRGGYDRRDDRGRESRDYRSDRRDRSPPARDSYDRREDRGGSDRRDDRGRDSRDRRSDRRERSRSPDRRR